MEKDLSKLPKKEGKVVRRDLHKDSPCLNYGSLQFAADIATVTMQIQPAEFHGS